MRFVLITFIAALCGSFAYAAECYVHGAHNDAAYYDPEFDYDLPGEGEYMLTAEGWTEEFSFAGFSYSYEIPDYEGSITVTHYDERVREDTHSEPRSIGAGCWLTPYVSIEGEYQYGMQATIEGRVGYTFTTEDGQQYRTEAIPYTATVSMNSFSGSMLMRLPIDDVFSLTGRLGVLRGEVEYAVRFPNVPGVHVLDRDTVWMPILGAGGLLQLSEHLSVGSEIVVYDTEGKSRLIRFTARIHF